jgi:hypothetical protein
MAQLAHRNRVVDCQDHCFSVHQWIFHTKHFITNKKAIDTLFITQASFSFSSDPVSPRRYLSINSEGVSAHHDDSNSAG